MRKATLAVCMAASFILFAQPAMAGTRIYVNLGLPAVQFDMGDEGPCEEDHVWVDGYYRFEHPRYVWVPGHWVPGGHTHAVYVRESPVYHRYDRYPGRDIHSRSPQDIRGYSSRRGHDGPRGTDHGNDIHRQDRYNDRGNDGNRTDGNWMNNVHKKILTK